MTPMLLSYFVAYVILCLLLAVLGRNLKFGPWAYFFASLLLTPIIGLLLVLASDPRRPRSRKRRA